MFATREALCSHSYPQIMWITEHALFSSADYTGSNARSTRDLLAPSLHTGIALALDSLVKVSNCWLKKSAS